MAQRVQPNPATPTPVETTCCGWLSDCLNSIIDKVKSVCMWVLQCLLPCVFSAPSEPLQPDRVAGQTADPNAEAPLPECKPLFEATEEVPNPRVALEALLWLVRTRIPAERMNGWVLDRAVRICSSLEDDWPSLEVQVASAGLELGAFPPYNRPLSESPFYDENRTPLFNRIVDFAVRLEVKSLQSNNQEAALITAAQGRHYVLFTRGRKFYFLNPYAHPRIYIFDKHEEFAQFFTEQVEPGHFAFARPIMRAEGASAGQSDSLREPVAIGKLRLASRRSGPSAIGNAFGMPSHFLTSNTMDDWVRWGGRRL